METQGIQVPLGRSWTIPPDRHGQRLDQALAAFFADLALRARRRLFDAYEVRVDGVPRSPSYKVKAGQSLQFVPLTQSPPEVPDENVVHKSTELTLSYGGKPRIVAKSADLAFLAKPAAWHSEKRGTGDSLEEYLPALGLPASACLLTRLDYGTSGLCLVALTEAARARFRANEQAGNVRKAYVCLLEGEMLGARCVAASLDTKGGAAVRVKGKQLAEVERQTQIIPVAHVAQLDASLCVALIHRGARHQIRAHAAKSGHPVHLDPVYGPTASTAGKDAAAVLRPFFLHCAAVAYEAQIIRLDPDWQGIPQELLELAGTRIDDLLAGPDA